MKQINENTAVIVNGVRTPFVRAFQEFTKIDTIELGTMAVKNLLKKTGLSVNEIDAICWGGVVLPATTPNTGREIILEAGLPPIIEGYTLTRACSSSLLAITQAAAAIERGEFDVVIAGGSDSVSNAEVALPRKLMQAFGPVFMNKDSNFFDYISVLAQLVPFNDILPRIPKVAERSTGQLMGESAEEMTQRNNISREAQDELALNSHLRAAAAVASGRFNDEVLPVEIKPGKAVYTDSIIRGNAKFEQLSKLHPVFKKNGTLTAGNSSALTDGAACTLLMSLKKAKELGFKPKARFLSWHYSGVDPRDQLLIGPAISMPMALKRAGMTINNIDLVDIHEAFAGQVLSVLKAWASNAFVQRHTNGTGVSADVASEKLNVHGGSVAIGHPFGATGSRMVNTMANEISTGDKSTALIGICAAGGLGAAAVMQRCD